MISIFQLIEIFICSLAHPYTCIQRGIYYESVEIYKYLHLQYPSSQFLIVCFDQILLLLGQREQIQELFRDRLSL